MNSLVFVIRQSAFDHELFLQSSFELFIDEIDDNLCTKTRSPYWIK